MIFPTLTISEGQMSGHRAKPKYNKVNFPANDFSETSCFVSVSMSVHGPPMAGLPASYIQVSETIKEKILGRVMILKSRLKNQMVRILVPTHNHPIDLS